MNKLDERIRKKLSPVDKEQIYDDFLDECYEEIDVGVKFRPSRVLKELDPITYDCRQYEYLSSDYYYELDDEFYYQGEVDKIIEDMEAAPELLKALKNSLDIFGNIETQIQNEEPLNPKTVCDISNAIQLNVEIIKKATE